MALTCPRRCGCHRALFLLLGLLAVPAEAKAHSPITGLGDFYAGVFHPLTTPVHLLLMVGIGLLAGRHRRQPRDLQVPMLGWILFSGASMLAATAMQWPGPHPALLIGVSLVVGLWLALNRNPGRLEFCAIAAGAAILLGLDSAAETGTWPARAKILLGNWLSVVVLTYDIAIYVALAGGAKWMRVGLQILGSWMIAIGLLALAFALRPA